MAADKFPPASFRGGRHQTPAAYIFTTLTNQMKLCKHGLISYKHEGFHIKKGGSSYKHDGFHYIYMN